MENLNYKTKYLYLNPPDSYFPISRSPLIFYIIYNFKFWKKKKRKTSKEVQEVTKGMREKGINNMECVDREEWRRKIKL